MTTIFQCPVCRLPLIAEANRYECSNQHHFDKAKAGYVNLLLANQKKSKNPGDNLKMVQSREAFLSAGYYQALAAALGDMIGNYTQKKSQTLLDIGCGEGYYLNALQAQYPNEIVCYGMDISKDAVRRAAVQYAGIEFAVASIAHLPVQDNSVDFFLNVFSPRNLPEMARVAKQDALLLCVTPESNHLSELRDIMYDEVHAYKQSDVTIFEPEFIHLDTQVISYKIDLGNQADITNLLQMTPFYWHISQEKQAQLMGLRQLHVSVSFELSVWKCKKNGDNSDN